MPTESENLVAEFGEEHRRLIEDVLPWLDKKEPAWGVKLDRRKFIQDLIAQKKKEIP